MREICISLRTTILFIGLSGFLFRLFCLGKLLCQYPLLQAVYIFIVFLGFIPSRFYPLSYREPDSASD